MWYYVKGDAFHTDTHPAYVTTTVAKCPATITVKDQAYVFNGKQQGEGDTAYNDPAQIAEKVEVEGLLRSDALTSIILDGAKADAGVYEGAIKVTGYRIGEVTDNYEVTLVPGTLTIARESCEISFVNFDGTVLQKTQVAYGTTPEYTGATPEKAATAQCTCTFAGWTPEVVAATDDATYTATYSETPNKYKVTFVDYDGKTVLKEAVAYDYGTPATDIERPVDPTRESDAQYTYAFSGWTPEVAAVTSDATYTATYEATPIPPAPAQKGTLAFDLGGGTIDGKTSLVIEANVGDVITIPEAPVRDGYTFQYWQGSKYYPGDKYTVEGDHTFTAVWEKKSDSSGNGSSADTKGTPSNTSGKSSTAKTGDTFGGAVAALGATAMLALCLALFALYRRRRPGEEKRL